MSLGATVPGHVRGNRLDAAPLMAPAGAVFAAAAALLLGGLWLARARGIALALSVATSVWALWLIG